MQLIVFTKFNDVYYYLLNTYDRVIWIRTTLVSLVWTCPRLTYWSSELVLNIIEVNITCIYFFLLFNLKKMSNHHIMIVHLYYIN